MIDETRSKEYKEYKSNELKLHKNVVSNLAKKLNIPAFKAGKQTIRDERNWRVDEIEIEYCWLVKVSKSFAGECWLFSTKYGASSFRESNNPEKLIQGFFKVNSEGIIEKFHELTSTENFNDPIRNLNSLDLFDASEGITLDGNYYHFYISAPNTEITINVGNPNSEKWTNWTKELHLTGQKISKELNIDFEELFFN